MNKRQLTAARVRKHRVLKEILVDERTKLESSKNYIDEENKSSSLSGTIKSKQLI